MTSRSTLFIAAGLLLGATSMQAAAQSSISKSNDLFVEARQKQKLGRFIVAPDGSFFIYEWLRPYHWNPDDRDLSKKATERMQAFLFEVRTPDEWDFTDEPTSVLLPYPKPGATYWLGNISPDGKWAGFYELDRDDKALRAGIVETINKVPPDIVWFDIAPDDARLDRAAAWSSDGKSLVYPIKGGLARVDAATGKAARCLDCIEPPALQTAAVLPGVATKVDRGDVPPQAKLVVTSSSGDLGVFAIDTTDTLNLYFAKKGKAFSLFENERK